MPEIYHMTQDRIKETSDRASAGAYFDQLMKLWSDAEEHDQVVYVCIAYGYLQWVRVDREIHETEPDIVEYIKNPDNWFREDRVSEL